MTFSKSIFHVGLMFSMLVTTEILGQDCKFGMTMGEKYDKCSAVCMGRNYKCVADGTCLCQSCPNGMPQAYVHTFEDTTCEFNQECSRRCMDVNTEPDHGGYIGRGKKCEFTDDFYGAQSSVCVCGCL